MARTKALYDPRQRLAQQAQYANTPAAGETVGQSAANQLSSREKGLQAIQAARQQMTPVMGKPVGTATPGSVTGQATVDAKGQYTQSYTPGQPAQIAPKNPLGELATVADQMKAAREKGDLGTLADLTTKQYLPQLESVQSTIGNVNTGQVGRILGEATANLPADLNAQRSELASLAQQLQTARETGDLGTANRLAQRYQALVTAMQGQVTGQPAPSSGAPAISPEIKQKIDSLGNQLLNPNLTDAQRQEIKRQQQELLASFGYTNPDQISMTKGGVPTSTIPEGGSGEVPAAGTGTQPYDAGQSYRGYANARHFDENGKPSPEMQQLIDFDNQVINNMPQGLTPEQQAAWRQQFDAEQRGFAQELEQYPDQWEKIFQNHQKRMQEIAGKWDTVGKYRSQLDQYFNKLPIEAKQKIEALPEVQKNEFYRLAIEAMQQGQDPAANIDKYLKKSKGVGTDFTLGAPKYIGKDFKLDEYKPSGAIEVAGADTVDLSTDKSRIDAALQRSGMTPEGQQALKLQLETIQKRLSEGGGGFSEQELKDMAAPILAANNRAMQADISAMQHDLAASGFESGPILAQKTAEIRQQYAEKNQAAITELVRENMGYKQQGTSEAIAALGGIAESERAGALSEKELALRGATTQTELTSKEKEAQAAANLAQKALSQEGELYVWGKKVDENLQAYGLSLDRYKTDRGFDDAALDRDLKERVAQGELTAEGAKLAYQKVKDSIDAAQKETELYDRRTTAIAELEQRAAQGDQDAAARVQALKIQQELSVLGLNSDETKAFANIVYGVMTNQLELDQEWKMFLEQIAAQKELKGNSFWDFAGQYVGAMGEVGAAAAIAGSSRDFKKDIYELSEADERAVFESLLKTKVVEFRYKEEAPTRKPHVGVIAEEAPATIVTDDGKHIDLADAFGMLLAAVKTLTREIAAVRSGS